MGLLGATQAHMPTEDESAAVDAEALERAEREKVAQSRELLRTLSAQIELANTLDEMKALEKKIAGSVKAQMVKEDVITFRAKCQERRDALRVVADNHKLDAEIAASEKVN